MRLVGYTRVSTEEQASNQSLPSQRERITAYCAAYEHELVSVVEDPGVSGKSLDRPGVQRVMAMLDSGEAEGVIVAKLDRLTRSSRDLWVLIDDHFSEQHRGKGYAIRPAAALVSVSEQMDTTTSAGRLVLGMFGLVSQWERETISERTRETMQSMRRRGLSVGRVPHGYRLAADGKALESDPAEQAAVQLARSLRAEGLSLRAIGRSLEEAGHANKAGGRWSASSVKLLMGAKR